MTLDDFYVPCYVYNLNGSIYVGVGIPEIKGDVVCGYAIIDVLPLDEYRAKYRLTQKKVR